MTRMTTRSMLPTALLVGLLTACGGDAPPDPDAGQAALPATGQPIAPPPVTGPATEPALAADPTPEPGLTTPTPPAAPAPPPAASALALAPEAVIARVTELRDRGAFGEAYVLIQELRSEVPYAERPKLDPLTADLRQLKRDRMRVQAAIVHLGDADDATRAAARLELLSIGEAARLLCRQALPESSGISRTELAGILAEYQDPAAWPIIHAAWQEAEAGSAARAALRISLERLIAAADGAALDGLLAAAAQAQSPAEHADSLGLLAVALREGVDLAARCGRSDAVEFVKQRLVAASESDDAELSAWAMGFADVVDLRRPGLRGIWYGNREFSGEPLAEVVSERIDWNGGGFPVDRSEQISARFVGEVRIDQAGSWTFATVSDDGSRLRVDGTLVVDNWGDHGMDEKRGSIELEPGYHAIELDYFQGSGGAGLVLQWAPPGDDATVVIPAERLFHAPR